MPPRATSRAPTWLDVTLRRNAWPLGWSGINTHSVVGDMAYFGCGTTCSVIASSICTVIRRRCSTFFTYEALSCGRWEGGGGVLAVAAPSYLGDRGGVKTSSNRSKIRRQRPPVSAVWGKMSVCYIFSMLHINQSRFFFCLWSVCCGIYILCTKHYCLLRLLDLSLGALVSFFVVHGCGATPFFYFLSFFTIESTHCFARRVIASSVQRRLSVDS